MPAVKRSAPDTTSRPHWRRIVERLPPLVGLGLLVFGAVALRRELRELDLRRIGDDLAAISASNLAVAAGCTLLSYFILSFYDRLAVIHVGRRISFGRTAFAAFCSYVLSHNLGFAAISGAAVRFRLYGNWGLRPVEITRIVAFCSVTYALGASTLAAIVLIGEPAALGALGHRLSPLLLRGIGLGFAAIVVGYIVLSCRLTSLAFRRFVLPLPGPSMACGQILVATLEVAATAAIAYALLPNGTMLAFPTFLALYLASYSAGLIASVPGGLGVFDGAMVLGLSPFVDTATAIVTILVFRLLYYIIPLFIAGLLFAGHELLLRGDAFWSRRRNADAPVRVRPSGLVRESEADFSVTVAAAIVVLDAAMLLALRAFQPFSPIAFALPPPADPFLFGAGLGLLDYLARAARVLGTVLPPVIGSALAGLAIGLSQRVTLAWGATLALLGLGAAVAGLAGVPIVVPGILLLSILVIAPFRSSYYRHARMLSEPLAPATVTPLFLLLACILILYRMDALPDARSGAPPWMSRLLPSPFNGALWFPATLALAVGLVAVARLMLPGRVSFQPWNGDVAERYRALMAEPADPLPPNGPDGVVFGESNRAAIPFRRFGRVLLAFGDPVGAPSDRVSTIWRLRDLAVQEGRQPAFCRVGRDFLDIYNDLGLQAWPMEDATLLCCHAERGSALRRLVQRLDRTDGGRAEPLADPGPGTDGTVAKGD